MPTPGGIPGAGKNPHAVALGRIGGLKGGPAGAEPLPDYPVGAEMRTTVKFF
jgi:hypothetical protein